MVNPGMTVEVHTREGLDTKKIKELIWSKLGEMPEAYRLYGTNINSTIS